MSDTTPDTALWQRAWEVISDVRDAYPRVAEDAPTDEIIEALVKAKLLRA